MTTELEPPTMRGSDLSPPDPGGPPSATRGLAAARGPSQKSPGEASGMELEAKIVRMIASIDSAVSAMVDAIIHDPAFQRLEAAWRGLRYVVDSVDFHENIKISIWNCSKEELATDIDESTELTRSRAFGHIYTEEFGQYGGEPYAAVLAIMEFDASPRDVQLLKAMAAIGAMSQAPFFAAASPRLLQLGSWRDLPTVADPRVIFEGARTIGWNSLRDQEDSRYVGLLLPRVLLRSPHNASDVDRFVYTEGISAEGDGLLWGNPVFVFAIRLASSFARYRTLGAIIGESEDLRPGPASVSFASLGPRHVKPPLEVLVTPRLERGLREQGFIPLQYVRGTTRMFLASANSLQNSKQFGGSVEGREATINYLLGTKFPYLFLACRVAHYLKVIERDTVGSHRSVEELEQDLNDWLGQYVVDMDSASPTVRARYPLRRAQVRVVALPESPGWYRAEIAIRPHLKYLGSFFTLAISSMLERLGDVTRAG
jgi:type VI secretion system protein ImpC